jgi:hypothetical protein
MYPGLSAMARDLLCIPLAGVGVERTFNFARDICHYRRGQLQPGTIRALLLVYHSQIRESRTDQFQKALSSTIDISNMTEEEIEAEIVEREYEISLRRVHLEEWDKDHYISDIEEGENILPRTARMQLRHDYIIRKNRRANPTRGQSQILSNTDRVQKAEHYIRAEEQQERDRCNPAIWGPPQSSDNEDNLESAYLSGSEKSIDEDIAFFESRGLLESQALADREPSLPPLSQQTPRAQLRKRRAGTIIDDFVLRRRLDSR